MIRSLSAVAAGAAIWLLLFAWRTWVAEQELAAAIAELRARGEPATLAELSEQVPPNPNGADELMRAVLLSGGETASNGGPAGDPFMRRTVELVCGGIPPFDPTRRLDKAYDLAETAEPGVHPEFALALAAMPRILPHLEKATAAPPGRLMRCFDDRTPWVTWMSPAIDVLKLAKMLRIEVLDALGRSEPRRAFRSLLLMSRLGECLADEPYLLSHLYRRSIDRQAAETLAVALGVSSPTPEESATLDAAYARWAADSFQAAIRGERCIALESLEPRHLEVLLAFDMSAGRIAMTPTWGSQARKYFLSSQLGRPTLLGARLSVIRFFNECERWADDPDLLHPTDAEAEAARAPLRDSAVLKTFAYDPQKFIRAIRSHRIAGWFARLALRAARHRDATGAYPESLERLSDRDVPSGPSPWLGGNPPLYQRTEKGFTIADPTAKEEKEAIRIVVKRR